MHTHACTSVHLRICMCVLLYAFPHYPKILRSTKIVFCVWSINDRALRRCLEGVVRAAFRWVVKDALRAIPACPKAKVMATSALAPPPGVGVVNVQVRGPFFHLPRRHF